jgi:hypothetical protein
MLTIISKPYEIEENLQSLKLNEEDKEKYNELIKEGKEDEAKKLLKVQYEFTMKITADELQKINNLMFDAESIKKAEEYNRLLQDEKFEEANKLLTEIDEISKKNREEFENIGFKEHKEPFKVTCGEYKYAEMRDLMQGFFWNIFISKKNKQVNTMLTDLMKITQK